MANPIKVVTLTIIVLVHILFSLSTLVFIVLHSLNLENRIITALALSTALSFVICKRCIAIDIYEYFRDGETDLPSMARDNFFRTIVQKILNSRFREDLTTLSLDIIDNVIPMAETSGEDHIRLFLNRKIHYILLNSILIIVLLEKFNLVQLLPLFIGWIFYSFPI